MSEEDMCAICLEKKRRPAAIKCGHMFCRQCIVRHQASRQHWSKHCPLCRKPFRIISTVKKKIEAAPVVVPAVEVSLNIPTPTDNTNDVFIDLTSSDEEVSDGSFVPRFDYDSSDSDDSSSSSDDT